MLRIVVFFTILKIDFTIILSIFSYFKLWIINLHVQDIFTKIITKANSNSVKLLLIYYYKYRFLYLCTILIKSDKFPFLLLRLFHVSWFVYYQFLLFCSVLRNANVGTSSITTNQKWRPSHCQWWRKNLGHILFPADKIFIENFFIIVVIIIDGVKMENNRLKQSFSYFVSRKTKQKQNGSKQLRKIFKFLKISQ